MEQSFRIAALETFARPHVGLLRVTLTDGTRGWGQIASFEAADIVATIVHRQIAPLVLGVDFASIEALLQRLVDRLLKFHGSHLSRGMAAVETSLLDALARRAGRLVVEWLGGEAAPVPVYGSSMSRRITPKDEAERLVRLQHTAGYRAFKIRVGREAGHDEDEWPGRTKEIVPAVRRALDRATTIHADANSCFSVARAIEVGRLLEHHGYGHFEEPCPYWMLEWTAEVARSLEMSVAGGEQDHSIATWNTVLRDRVVDIVQPDICYCGGLTVALDIARRAAALGLLCVPHSANHSLIHVFTMHLWNLLPNRGPYMEHSIEEQAMYAGMIDNPPRLVDGLLHLDADGGGWGIRVNDGWLAASNHQASTMETSG